MYDYIWLCGLAPGVWCWDGWRARGTAAHLWLLPAACERRGVCAPPHPDVHLPELSLSLAALK